MFVGLLLEWGTDARAGEEQLLSKDCPGADVFVVMGQNGLEGHL